jgi:hypothetical protein
MEELCHTFYLSQLIKWIASVNFTSNSWIYTIKCWMKLGCFKLVIKFAKMMV